MYDSPTTELTVLDIATRFGYVRETNFGRFFDVRSVPKANDLAYSPVPLGPHTDNPYRDPVPGLQLLHCLANSTDGGESVVVDGFAAAHRLRDADEAAFLRLARTPRETWQRPRGSSGATRMVQFLRIERGRTV